jgi:hypothetical protein
MPKFVEMDDKVTLFAQGGGTVAVASAHLFTKVAVPGICGA